MCDENGNFFDALKKSYNNNNNTVFVKIFISTIFV